MEKILLLVTCLGIGFFLRRTKFFDEKSAVVLNNLIVYFFIPVLTLHYVPKIDFEFNLIWLSITPFVVYLSSFLFIKSIAKFVDIDKKTTGALIMSGGVGSISFVGFPIFEVLYGQEGLSYGIILSLAGTFFVFNTVGLYTGLHYAQTENKSDGILKKVVTFPPFVAFIIALFINFFDLEYHILIEGLLMNLSKPFSVLALLAIGMQIDFSMDKQSSKMLLIGQFHKLIIAPIVIYILMWHFLGMTNVVSRICILGAGIGSMNAISILAAQMGLNPKLATLMPAIGIPLSVPLLFLIDYFLRNVG